MHLKNGGDEMTEQYRVCRLCPRACGVDRAAGKLGRCGVSSTLRVARAALHFWEEPPISGEGGSGAVFFSGCGLGCIFCQNREIARGCLGEEITEARLAEIFLELWRAGAENLNLVTATQYAPSVISALADARRSGLDLPVVWNSSGYEAEQTLKALDGSVDIYLPDFKYATARAAAYSSAPDYPKVAMAALSEMLRQVGEPRFDGRGMLRRGVLVRILLLPGNLLDAKLALRRLYDRFGDRILYSLMSQYTPMPGMPSPLDRRVTDAEYRSFTEYADAIGIRRAYVQESGCAEEDFIPPFDLTGVREPS
jgi:putative pyruvate formate lyase activating enzyme